MESFTTLNHLYLQSTGHRLADSALPNAPVLPYAEPKRRFRRLYSSIRHPVHRPDRRPAIDVRPVRYSHEC